MLEQLASNSEVGKLYKVKKSKQQLQKYEITLTTFCKY